MTVKFHLFTKLPLRKIGKSIWILESSILRKSSVSSHPIVRLSKTRHSLDPTVEIQNL